MVNMIMMMMIKIIIEVGEITIYCNKARLQKQMKCILKRINQDRQNIDHATDAQKHSKMIVLINNNTIAQ